MSLPSRMFDLADHLVRATGAPQRLPEPAAMIEQAVRATGASDFGGWAFEEPLAVLREALEREADLNLFGRLSSQWDLQRFLTNLLRLRAAEAASPAIADEPIAAPIFITGLPRSGTSFLHALLAEDPANQVPLCWQTIVPYPEPRPGARDPRPAQVARQLKLFGVMAPEFDAAHPFTAESPQECSEITAYVFRSLRFDTTHFVPSYRAWLDQAGHLEAYRFHRRFLQHLQAQARAGGGETSSPRRWVLKCPDHVFALEALRAVYPDARLVFCHRDPLKVLASNAQLTEILRRPFTRRIDRPDLGRQESDRWRLGVERMMQAAQAAVDRPEGGAFHVRHTELIGDPVGTVAALYRHFGVSFDAEARARVTARVQARPDGGYRPRAYRLEDYGLDPAQERRRFADYMAFFAVQAEAGAARPSAETGRAARPGGAVAS